MYCESGSTSSAQTAAVNYVKTDDPSYQTITYNNPPATSPSGTSYTGFWQVTVEDSYKPIFAPLVGFGSTLLPGGKATAGCYETGEGPSVLVLDPSVCGSLTGNGNISIAAPNGSITVDSSCSSAVQLTGNVTVQTATASPMAIVGGYLDTGNVTISPKPVKGAQSVADPYASMALPSIPSVVYGNGSCTAKGAYKSTTKQWQPCYYANAVSFSGNNTVTYAPGTYLFASTFSVSGNQSINFGAGTYVFDKAVTISGNTASFGGGGTYVFYGGLSISGNQKVTLGAGAYIFDGGNLTLAGNSSLTGNGVLLYFLKNSSGSTATISEGGNASFSLTPATTGAYAGFSIIQAKSDTATASLVGNTAFNTSQGLIYIPGGALDFTGNATVQITFVVNEFDLTGNSSVTVDGYNGTSVQQVNFGLVQ